MRAGAFLIINCFVTSKNWNLFVFKVFFFSTCLQLRKNAQIFFINWMPPQYVIVCEENQFFLSAPPVCFMYFCPLPPLFDCRILHWVNVTRSWIPVWKSCVIEVQMKSNLHFCGNILWECSPLKDISIILVLFLEDVKIAVFTSLLSGTKNQVFAPGESQMNFHFRRQHVEEERKNAAQTATPSPSAD